VEAFVNAVNTVGVMGKGLALAFKQRFPDSFRLMGTGPAADGCGVRGTAGNRMGHL
jgi:O-acetyl-ADP-ribose deacetylase (regulator of RNase III)